MTEQIDPAERAWREYRDGLASSHPRRSLRKREFLAGWRARAIHQIALDHAARVEGTHVPQTVLDLIASGRIIPAIKEMRIANTGMSLFDAKVIVERLRDRAAHD